MDKIKFLKFIVVVFMSLNFLSLIFGYVIYKDNNFSNSSNHFNKVNSQTAIFQREKEILLNNYTKLKQSNSKLNFDLKNIDSQLINLKTQLSEINSNKTTKTITKKIDMTNLNSKLDSLNSKIQNLKIQRNTLYQEYLLAKQRAAQNSVRRTRSS